MASLNKFFTICMVFSPLLMMYHIPSFSSITFLDVALVSFVIIILIAKMTVKKPRIEIDNFFFELLPFLIYILFQFFVLAVFKFDRHQIIDIGLRTFRYAFYLIIIIFFTKKYFIYDLGLTLFKGFVIFAASYFFIQLFLLRNFNFYLKGYFPFLPVVREELIVFSERAANNSWTRVRSIFGEISQFSIVATGYLCISLFKENSFNEIRVQLLITVALLLSVSSLGVLSTIAIWMVWIIFRILKFKNIQERNFLLLVLMIVISVFAFIVFSHNFHLFASRLDVSTFNRFEGYYDYYNDIRIISIFEFIFGIGMDLENLDAWYSSIAKIIYFFGIGGFIFFVLSLFMTYYYLHSRERLSSIILFSYFILLSLGTEVFISNFILLYFPFILLDKETKPIDLIY